MRGEHWPLGRTVALALLLAAGLLAVAWWTSEWLLLEPPPSPRPAPVASPTPAPVEEERVVVTAVQGLVERSAAGRWVRARAGDRLEADASLRTAGNARANLQVGDADSRLTVPEGSQLAVREVTRAAHSFRLSRGRIAVDYRPDGERVLRIEAESGAVAETHGARFTVLRTGTVVAVATESGAVDLSAAGVRVTVGAGQQALARDGQAPSPAEAIPTELLLKVARHAADASLCAEVEGRVWPGTEVRVDAAAVAVDGEGRFRVRVPRRAGLSVVQVRAVAPDGKERLQPVPCQAGERPDPDARIRIDWDAPN